MRYIVQTMNPEVETSWRQVGGFFEKARDAEDDMDFCRSRNPSNKYRVIEAAAATAQPEAVATKPSRTNWRGTIFLVRRGPGDYWDRFAEQYPEVFTQVLRVIDHAGTSDADAAVLRAAGALLADLEDWARRARAAMRERRAILFDSLAGELATIIGEADAAVADAADRPGD